MQKNTCSDCQRIWREYADAMAEHLGLQLQRYMASPADALPPDLDTLISIAETRSESIRMAMREHEAASHASSGRIYPGSAGSGAAFAESEGFHSGF